MKDLIISGSDYNHITHMIDEAEISARFGNQVYFLLCNHHFRYCGCNMFGSPFKCFRCERFSKRLLKKCSPSVKVIEMDKSLMEKLNGEIDKVSFDYHTVKDIKSLVYKGANVGMGCLSAYISHSRNNNPMIDDEFRAYFDKVLRKGCLYAEFQYRMMMEIKPDRVQLFNGRFMETRAASDLAILHHFLLRSNELWRVFPHRFIKRQFYNALPHSLEANHKWFECLWADEYIPQVEKERIGRRFFESKYEHAFGGDKDYTARQVAAKLPDNWDKSKKNYVIFNSSEDEFTAIGGEYDEKKVFDSQYEGVMHIANLFKDRKDVNVYLRIHPNLTNIKYKYHTGLLSIGANFNNLFVIPGDSSVSSYALMREAYRVITFGSTTGIEATYMGKTVIALCSNWFSGLDVSYNPESYTEADHLIQAKDLSPKPQIEAIKFGYFIMNLNLPSFSFFDYNISDFYFLGRTLRRYNLAKYFGSTTLYAIVGWIGEFLCGRDVVPDKEA